MTDTVSLIRRTAKALRDWRPDPAEEIAVVVEHLLMVRSALQVVERQYGTLELHGRDPASVRMAAGIVLERLRLCATTAPGPRSSPSRRSPRSAPARPARQPAPLGEPPAGGHRHRRHRRPANLGNEDASRS